ncbi:GNAT family N-acetyltransferase [Kribbella turkmenica]|nr:GNAT family N-acetyltransferase [Kribbella turkmenica]
MTDQVLLPDGTGFYLAGGELTVADEAGQTIAGSQPVDFSVTAGLVGSADPDVTLADWSTAQTDDLGGVRSEDGLTVLTLRTQPLMLNSLPSSVRVRLRTPARPQGTEGAWQLVLHFRNHAGSSLTWHASLPTEAFGAGWLAPLADLLSIDGTGGAVDPASAPPQCPEDGPGSETAAPSRRGDAGSASDGHVAGRPAATGTSTSPAATVVHHSVDEYYELLVDGHQAGLLIYHVIGSNLSITHTVIEPTYRGRGLSWVLIGHALDDIRTKFATVSNYCAVVRRFGEKNPEYHDLLSLPRPT